MKEGFILKKKNKQESSPSTLNKNWYVQVDISNLYSLQIVSFLCSYMTF